MKSKEYVHGYTKRETQRLQEQSLILEELLHTGTQYPAGSRVLEVGCGVGAQTVILLRRNPGIHLTSIDMSAESVHKARETVEKAGGGWWTSVIKDESQLKEIAEYYDMDWLKQ